MRINTDEVQETEAQREIRESVERVEALYDRLAEAGVTHVTFQWYGSGDEGGIDRDQTLFQRIEGDVEVGVSPDDDLAQETCDALDDALTIQLGGWWNGNGGAGTGTMDVAARKTVLEHGWYEEVLVSDRPIVLGEPEPTPLQLANEQVRQAGLEWSAATEALNHAEARYCALSLLDLAGKYPEGTIKSFSYDEEWSSDDEGGYFSSCRVYVTLGDNPDEDALSNLGDPDDDDELSSFTKGGLERLFGEIVGPFSEERTIEDLRKFVGNV